MDDSCIQQPDGSFCRTPSSWDNCRPWDLTQQPNESCFAEDILTEAVDRAGAPLNVYKLQGVHEQTKLIDSTGNGKAISSGSQSGFPAANAYTTLAQEWRSRQSGSADILTAAFIGYDFGVVKLPGGRARYGIDASIRKHITALDIKQSNNPLYRITKARVERSDDGKQWYGVAVVTLPDSDTLSTVYFKHSVSSRYWRLRPISFASGDCNVWAVQALRMYEYSVTDISNIQDKVLFENRDRDYSPEPIAMRGYYELMNISTDLSRFGIETPSSAYQIKIPFATAVAKLGRPLVIGDIIELLSETQYGADMRPVKKYVEVTDVAWDASTYTPGWRPTMLLVTTAPAMATQETQDIFGSLAKHVDSSGLFDTDDGNSKSYQDYSAISHSIANEAKTAVPERGADVAGIRQFEQSEVDAAKEQGFDHLNRMGANPTGLYVEDGMPPNGADYTTGPIFPTNPNEGQYHRLTYTGLAKDVPPRLHRWSPTKGNWIYLETDRRQQYNNTQPVLQEFLTSPTRKPAREIK